MTDRSLDSLEVKFRTRVVWLLARLVEAGIPVFIVNTRRTAAEQRDACASGHSWLPHSKHQDGLAIDLVPYEIYQLAGADKLEWNGADPVWQRIGKIGESMGLVWGGRWEVRDMGHFEAP